MQKTEILNLMENFFDRKNIFGWKKMLDKKYFCQQSFWVKRMVQEMFSPKTYLSENILDTKNLSSKKFGQNWVLMLRYCCHRQMSSGQMLPGQMSPWHMASVKEGSRTYL